MDIYQLKVKLANIGQELKNVSDELFSKLDNPLVTKDELDKLRVHKADVQERFNDLKAELERAVKLQEEGLKEQPVIKDDNTKLIDQKADAIRAMISGQKPDPNSTKGKELLKVLNQLEALPAGGGTGGEYLLPTEMTSELVQEPLITNPLRGNIKITNISGLEVPKISFTLATNDNFIGDSNTAKELDAVGDKVTFGRFKSKVKVQISDSVIHGTNTNLVSTVENNLRSGLAKKEKQVAFIANASAEANAAHMSFYEESGGNTVITEVTGTNLYTAIINAIAALHEDFREGAKVCMKFSDYVGMLLTLANGAMDLFSAPPEKIIGKPVIFSDSATTPIVGNFNYCHLNYDGQAIYDTDKNIDSGLYLFVLTAWLDQYRILDSAFRLAVVEESV